MRHKTGTSQPNGKLIDLELIDIPPFHTAAPISADSSNDSSTDSNSDNSSYNSDHISSDTTECHPIDQHHDSDAPTKHTRNANITTVKPPRAPPHRFREAPTNITVTPKLWTGIHPLMPTHPHLIPT